MSALLTDQKVHLTSHSTSIRERLVDILINNDLDFHDQESRYSSHNFHSFPAKFPPQLPKVFIDSLTLPGDLVLDPMQGSGTTVLEAYFTGRRSLGFDIDPLANIITTVKTTPINPLLVLQVSNSMLRKAATSVKERSLEIFLALEHRWDVETRQFVDYWFDTDTQIELMALTLEIERVSDPAIRNFLKAALSAIIITKTGGVSLALDLAHTRPHRAKLVYSRAGEILEGAGLVENPPRNLQYVTKNLRSPIEEFGKRIQNNIKGLLKLNSTIPPAKILFGNAQALPLESSTVDLIVTSPPYASNAIDYMRAHKFSLVWLGFPLHELSEKRKEYIGGETVTQFEFESVPEYTAHVISEVTGLDSSKGQVLHRYYSEMTRVLREMYRVLKPGKAAVVVVGNSDMRGRDTETQNCLADIGKAIGFEVPAIGVRSLDRNRRMLPAGEKIDRQSQIQKRMHEEYVIGFYKPGMA
jgi:DNA modification methylase